MSRRVIISCNVGDEGMGIVSSSRLLHIIFSLCILDFFIFYHRVKDLMLQLCVVLVVQYSKYGREKRKCVRFRRVCRKYGIFMPSPCLLQ